MVRCAISYDRRSSLIILHTSLTAQQYVYTIQRPILLPFLARYPGTNFQEDNTRPHTARIFVDYLCAINTLKWPERSQIEHVWNMEQR
ncbi:transposable element Tc1 transposase [Trichonephila clavipes]|nr:transposable element Tc1 transposase [Trichonephila clavipes]